MEYYDDELKSQVAKLTEADRLKLIGSLFNAMTNSMRAFYLQAGHSDREIDIMINNEIKGVRQLVAARVRDLEVEANTIIDPDSGVPLTEAKPPMDDQMVNDAMIDLGLIIQEFGVKPE